MVSFIVYCPKIIKVAFILLSKILLALKIAELSRALVFFSQWLSVCACRRHKLAQHVATETELVVAKIDGLLPPNFLMILKL